MSATSDKEPGIAAGRDDGWCFVCGPQNPAGLRLAWSLEEQKACARFQPGRVHQGWQGVLHGGILAALLDEAMAQRLRFSGIRAVTANLNIRYRKPASTLNPLLVEGVEAGSRGRILQLRSRVLDQAGEVLAEAEGTYVRVAEDPQSDRVR